MTDLDPTASGLSRESLEMESAYLRGMRDFLSGQPFDLPSGWRFGHIATSEAQRNFAWSLGYECARESDLYRLMVRRADKANELAAEVQRLSVIKQCYANALEHIANASYTELRTVVEHYGPDPTAEPMIYPDAVVYRSHATAGEWATARLVAGWFSKIAEEVLTVDDGQPIRHMLERDGEVVK